MSKRNQLRKRRKYWSRDRDEMTFLQWLNRDIWLNQDSWNRHSYHAARADRLAAFFKRVIENKSCRR